jgi:RNA polymerase sigma-70 factor (ECF subfamily)
VSERGSTPPPSKATLDDSELLAALRAGDASVATALYERTQPIVARTVARLLGRHDSDTEDVSQLALIELVNTIERFRGDCPLDAWVSVLTARVVYKQIRRRRLERKLFSSVPAHAFSVATSSTRRDVLFRDALRKVERLLEKVNADRAWTFLLHDAFGYDLREVAEITGVSLAAAQSRLVRGRSEVQARVAGDHDLAALVNELYRVEGEE